VTHTALKIAGGALGVCLVSVCALAGGAPAEVSNNPSELASSTIPVVLLSVFEEAAASSPCGLPWTLLAAVADNESDFDLTAVSNAGAQGLFQFEPTTFAEYAEPVPAGGAVPASPFDPFDAATAAGRYMCSLGVTENPTDALIAYNCGNTGPACQAASAGYAEQVLATAASYSASSIGVENGVEAAAVSYAESQIGTPYVFGGASPTAGFDCSGLVVWAYALAGLSVPAGAEQQWQTEPHVALDELVPGDLVFFGAGPGSETAVADHVGIYVGNDSMVDAPHTGAEVRIDTFSAVVGAPWGNEVLLGAADPTST
jgi:cell wall-associated NlpC family hydrolase